VEPSGPRSRKSNRRTSPDPKRRIRFAFLSSAFLSPRRWMAPRAPHPPRGPPPPGRSLPVLRPAAKREGMATLGRISCAAGRFCVPPPSISAKELVRRDAEAPASRLVFQRRRKIVRGWHGMELGWEHSKRAGRRETGRCAGYVDAQRVLPLHSSSYLGIPAGSPLRVPSGRGGG